METKKTDKRKILLFLPLLVLPFMALAFYALGGGKGNENANQQVAQKGINTSLPDASFNQKEEPQDKMGFYQQNDRDSSGKNNGIKNVADRLGFNGQEEDPQTKAINEKLKALNTEIAKPTPVVNNGSSVVKPQPTSMKSDVDRLEALMKAMKENKEEDPEMAQLSGMMDKIIAIQNPGIVQDKLKQQPALPVKADSAFKAIPAVIEGNQKVAQGAVVKLRLLDTIHLKDVVIPKNQLLFGSCNITNQRLLLTIKNIRLGSSIIPVDLSVFSLDGLIGIDAPEAELGEAAGNGATDAIQGMQFLSMDQSIGVQAAGAGIDAAKNLLSKKVKRIRVKLKGGQQILLRNNSQRP